MAQITTIVPTYKRPALLKRALASVLQQGYRDFEVHVCDNASDDETPEVVGEFSRRDARVRYVRRERNVGMVPNFTEAMRAVRTPLFNILNDDDFLLPGFYEAAVKALRAVPEAQAFFGAILYVSPEGRVVHSPAAFEKEGVRRPPELLGLVSSHTWPGVLFRTSLLETVGYLGENLTAADTDFLWRITARHAIIVSHQPVGVVILHPEGVSSAVERRRLLSDLRSMYDRVDEQRDLEPQSGVDLRRCISSAHFRMALQALPFGEREAAVEAASVLRRKMGRPLLGILAQLLASRIAAPVSTALIRAGWKAQSRRRRIRCAAYDVFVAKAIRALDGWPRRGGFPEGQGPCVESRES